MGGGGFSQRLEPSASTSICDQSVGNQVFGTLIRRDTKTNKPVPNLAESWEIVDPSTFTFKLRPNLTFQDGTKLDAAAAKAVDRQVTRAPTSALARRATTLGPHLVGRGRSGRTHRDAAPLAAGRRHHAPDPRRT